jgi:hypothetical protein
LPVGLCRRDDSISAGANETLTGPSSSFLLSDLFAVSRRVHPLAAVNGLIAHFVREIVDNTRDTKVHLEMIQRIR